MAGFTLEYQNMFAVQQFANAMYDLQVGSETMDQVLSDIAFLGSADAAFNAYYDFTYGAATDADVAATMVANLGIGEGEADAAIAYISGILGATTEKGAAAYDIISTFSGLDADPVFGAAATAWNAEVDIAMNYDSAADVVAGTEIIVEPETFFMLTAYQDIIDGSAGNDMFLADVVQEAGLQVNSMGTGDNIRAGEGDDALSAQLVTSATFQNMGDSDESMAAQPRINSVEEIKLEALNSDFDDDNDDGVNSFVYFNAKNVEGVDALWSWYSDANLIVQDMTTIDSDGSIRPVSDMTIGMGYTGNDDHNWDESDFTVYFDQDYLNPEINNGGTTNVAYKVMNQDAYDNINLQANSLNYGGLLDGVFFSTLQFELAIDGVDLGIDFNLIPYLAEDGNVGSENQTYQDVVDTLNAAASTIAADYGVPILEQLDFSIGANFNDPGNTRVGQEIVVTLPAFDPETGESIVLSVVDTDAELADGQGGLPGDNRYDEAVEIQNPTTTQDLRINVALEKVGRAADGGDLVIGSMDKDGDNLWSSAQSESGINIFDVTVYGDDSKPSSLGELRSTNNVLEEINVVTAASETGENGYADLSIASVKDIQTFDASGFKGDLSLGATLTNEVVAKYMDLQDTAAVAADNIDFVYTGGVGNDRFNVTMSDDNFAFLGTTTREDFDFTVDGGAGNDSITTFIASTYGSGMAIGVDDSVNWYRNSVENANLEANGGTGDDTITTRGAGDFVINAGDGEDTVYANNDGNVEGALIQEVQTITFGAAGDLDTQGQVTVTLADGSSFTSAGITTGMTASQVATQVAAASPTFFANGDTVRIVYTAGQVDAAAATNGDIAMATVSSILTDTVMAAPVITTPAAPGTAAAAATFETVVMNAAAVADGDATDTLTFVDGTVVTLVDTDANGSVEPFEIAEQVAAASFTDFTVTASNPSLGTVDFVANTAGNVADMTINGAGVTAPALAITQGTNAVAFVAGTAEVQTLTFTNGADQAGSITLGIDLDADGAIAAAETFEVAVGYGNEADVAADVASAIDALPGVSAAQGAAAPNLNDVIVTWATDLADPVPITMTDGAVRSATIVETVKGQVDNSGDPATWVVNTVNTDIDDLDSAGVTSLASVNALLYGATLTVTYSGAQVVGESGVIEDAAVAYANGFESAVTIDTWDNLGNEANINQAIKAAINDDAVLEELLVANDGPANTLVIESRVDGRYNVSDLDITVTAATVADLTSSEVTLLKTSLADLNNTSAAVYTDAQLQAALDAAVDSYTTGGTLDQLSMATNYDAGLARFELMAGNASTSVSDNDINLGTGLNDVAVLGTDDQSNDTIVLTGTDIGHDTIFNFVADQASAAADQIDLRAYLTNVTSVSGSAASQVNVAASLTFASFAGATAVNESEVLFINDFAPAVGETWTGLDGSDFLAAIINTASNDPYGNITSADLDVAAELANLVGTSMESVVFVENNANDGEYKVFDVTASATTDEFTDVVLLGVVDFGDTIDAATGATANMILG